MPNANDPITDEELLQEKDLHAVYLCARALPESKLNRRVTITFAALLAISVYLGNQTASELATLTRELVNTGLTFTISILSFLIAGFTIYLTVTNSDMLVALSERRHNGNGLPWIKYIAFHFLRVMAVYIGFLLYCLAVQLFGSPNGALSNLLALLPSGAEQVRWQVAAISFVLTAGVMVNMVMLLQSFVANIYTTTMMNIVDERRRRRRRERAKKNQQAASP
ncbi:MAG: hypothetical protein AzoDbin1_03164 [Azoarcus sp.]|uniref:Uncharacterized protein n=1 Tax=Aromatoleum tolulyticum TaxID=34027 RepID=A0A1N6T6T1_9RHOO|nr:hypothetical protein [Aromatoleum tolulyticum]MCK9986692.1 hypothetical protein [Azoarcus sp.]SIQ48816.1 hypothetical protein SAMN05421829_104340 [Aromatoleum tolulyticum]